MRLGINLLATAFPQLIIKVAIFAALFHTELIVKDGTNAPIIFIVPIHIARFLITLPLLTQIFLRGNDDF